MIPIKNEAVRFILVVAFQVFSLWGVVKLWQTIGPIVGFPIASRWDRGADKRFFEVLQLRGQKPPPSP
jgi:hypothetical protein